MLKTRCPSCHIVDLEAENARLQTRVEEAEQRLSEKTDLWDGAFREIEALAKTFLAERDDYKALAKLLREKLDSFGVAHTDGVWHLWTCEAGFIDDVREMCEDDCAEIAALIAMTPDEAREKEG